MLAIELRMVDGYFDKDTFVMKGLNGHALEGRYKAKGLRSMARLIGSDPITLIIDKYNRIRIPVDLNNRYKLELNMIADELENLEW